MRTPPLRAYVIAAAIVIAATLAEYALSIPGGVPALLLRFGWACSLIAIGRLRHAHSGLAEKFGPAFAVWNSAVCAVLAYLAGGLNTLSFYGLVALPLVQSAFIRDRVPSAVAGAIANFAGAVAVVAFHRPASLGLAIIIFAAIGAAAVQTAFMYRSFAKAAVDADRHLREEAARFELQQAEAAVRQANAERLAALGRMAAAVAHEVNNPLAYVRANLSFLRTEVQKLNAPEGVKEELLEVFDESVGGLEQIQQIASDLRGLARERPEVVRPVKVCDTVERALRIANLRIGRRVRVELDGVSSVPKVLVAQRRLIQVLINLLANAGDALAGGNDGRIIVSARETGDFVTLSVADNGPGLPAGWETTLFRPFFTTKGENEGTGLGLTLSRQYVESFGGALWAAQRKSGGARFFVSVPVAEPSGSELAA